MVAGCVVGQVPWGWQSLSDWQLSDSRRSTWISQTLLSLQETTAEIRVRGAFLLLLVFATVAAQFGLEAILGAFLAGAALKLVDRDRMMTHSLLRPKLQAVGFGVFIPVFFVSTGMKLDVVSLLTNASILVRVPIFLLAILVVCAAPAIVCRGFTRGRQEMLAAGVLRATSLSIPVVAGQIGVDLGLIRAENYVALVAAGLLSGHVVPGACARPRAPREPDPAADSNVPRPRVSPRRRNTQTCVCNKPRCGTYCRAARQVPDPAGMCHTISMRICRGRTPRLNLTDCERAAANARSVFIFTLHTSTAITRSTR